LSTAARAAGLRTVALDLGGKLRQRTALAHARNWRLERARLLDTVRRLAPDVVVTQFTLEQLLLAGTPGRHVAIQHGPAPATLVRFTPARRQLARYYAGCERVFSVSEQAAATLADIPLSWPPVLLPSGVREEDVRSAPAARAHLRQAWNAPDDVTVLAYVGRLERNKGLPEALELARSEPSLRLVVAGDGALRAGLETFRDADLGTGPVRYLGRVGRPLEVLAAADVTLLLTRDPGEGRPLALVESLAVGTPVLGSTHPALVAARAGGFGPWLHLVRDPVTVADVRAARAAVAGATRPDVPRWSDTARTFAATLGPATLRSA
jgi:glycosyltransferase involved in cell wall biosynthesis